MNICKKCGWPMIRNPDPSPFAKKWICPRCGHKAGDSDG